MLSKLRLTFLAAALLLTSQIFAHAIWIETDLNAVKGKNHTAKVFFGEYGGNERDTVANWFSDLNKLSVWLVTPGGEKKQLEAKPTLTAIDVDFTPETDGIYKLLIYHVVKDLHGKAKIEYNASATIVAGKAAKEAANSNEVALQWNAEKAVNIHKALPLTVLVNGKPAKEPVEIVLPGTEGQKFTSDEKGLVTFTPAKPGKYMVEIMHNDKVEGTHNDKPYTSVWKIATECIDVK